MPPLCVSEIGSTEGENEPLHHFHCLRSCTEGVLSRSFCQGYILRKPKRSEAGWYQCDTTLKCGLQVWNQVNDGMLERHQIPFGIGHRHRRAEHFDILTSGYLFQQRF